MEINYAKVKINLPASLDELTLKQFIEYSLLSEKIKEDDDSVGNILNTYKIIEIITGASEEEVDELLIDEVKDLSEKLKVVLNQSKFNESPDRHIVIDGVDYVAVNTNELTNGEYISLNILKEKYTTEIELLPRMLAILVRPGTKVFDSERNEEIWSVEKFNRRDINNLELRAEKFLAKGRAKDLIPVINFFLTMKEK